MTGCPVSDADAWRAAAEDGAAELEASPPTEAEAVATFRRAGRPATEAVRDVLEQDSTRDKGGTTAA